MKNFTAIFLLLASLPVLGQKVSQLDNTSSLTSNSLFSVAYGGTNTMSVSAGAIKDFAVGTNFLDVTLPPYNAAGNGTTDDTAAITNALWDASRYRKSVWLPPKTYKVSPFTVYTNAILEGYGAKLLFSSASSGVAITLDYTSSNIVMRGVTIDGGNAASIPVSDDGRTGVLIWNSQQPGWIFEDVDVLGFGKNIEIYGVSANTTSLLKFANVNSRYGWKGCQIDGQAEYLNITGLRCTVNHVGIYLIGGNNNFASCDFSRNNFAAVLDSQNGGDNPGHSTFTACAFNHSNTRALSITNFALGQNFSGCAFLPPTMVITNAQGIQFESCFLGWTDTSSVIAFYNSTNCSIINPINPYAPGVTNSYSVTTTACQNVRETYTDRIAVSQSGELNALGNITSATAGLTLGIVAGPSLWWYGAGGQFVFTGGTQGFLWNNQANSVNIATMDNSGNFGVVASGSFREVYATNFIALVTNYSGANFSPTAGLVKFVASNSVIYAVSSTKTNLISDLR